MTRNTNEALVILARLIEGDAATRRKAILAAKFLISIHRLTLAEISEKDAHRILFSECDADLAALRWGIYKDGYATKSLWIDGKKKTVNAQRVVLARVIGRALKKNEIPDHINGNRIDNRRENLRLTNHSGNAQNRKTKNPFRGAHWCSTRCKWRARATLNGTIHQAGIFATREEAAAAAAAKRKELGFLTGAE